jgi:hypothetical protein
MKKTVYFIASLTEGIALGHDMRRDFAAHSHGTRDKAKAIKWLADCRAKLPDASIHLFSTPSFVLDESAELTEELVEPATA